jgi:EmrB/QacA subfamily drug resistance transporter
MFEATVPPRACAPSEAPAPDPRGALLVAILGTGMAFLDGTVVNVALPVMQRDLHATVAGAQWIVEAYALMLASLVLVGGALGDRLGRRRVLTWGVVIFAASSAACGGAPTIQLLVLARGLQGVGAALLVPGSLALISAAYPDHARGKAIGTWSAASAVTAAVGPVAGGWVVAHASWRWLFFFNVPVAAATVALAARHVRETRDDSAPARLDVPGAVLATTSLGLVTYALIDAGGVASPRVLALLATGAVAFGAFLRVESRRQAPMVPLSLFGSRTFSGANLLTLFLYAALGGALFFVPFDLIQVQGYSPAAAGAALLPFVVLVSSLSPWAGALATRHGPRPLLFAGPLVAAAGFALLAIPATGGSYWSTFFPALAVLGTGMGFTVAPLTTAVMGAVDPRRAGVASGINNAVARAGGLLAVAGLGLLLVARFNRTLDVVLPSLALGPDAARAVAIQRDRLGAADFSALGAAGEPLRRAFESAYIAAFRALLLACAALAALGGLVGRWLIEPRP